MQTYSLTFNKEKFIHPILDNKVSKVVQFSFPKGKVLEKHKTTSPILIFVISGKVRFKAGEENEVLLQSGSLLSLESNVEHAVEALEESIMLLTLTPSPSAHTLLRPSEAEHHTLGPEAKGSIARQLQSFVLEHEELLKMLDRAENEGGTAVYTEADQLVAEELTKHFRYEEEILFPLLGKYIGMDAGPIAVMLAEHKTIRGLHQAFHHNLEEVDSGCSVEAETKAAFLSLADMLRTHITKEDNVLFPMASRVMSEDDKNEVERKVQEEDVEKNYSTLG